MANHPYNQHREQQVAHRRVNTILNGSPAGAKKHAEGGAYSKVTSKTAAMHHDDIAGSSSPKRYARGGKVKGDTNINIVIPGGGKPPMPPPMMAGPPPGAPPGPPMPPPGMPPGGPPPGVPMRAKGGRVGKFTGGAATGVGREEKAASAKKRK